MTARELDFSQGWLAIAACVFVWLLIWRTKLGYEIRAYGKSEQGALYAGIPFYSHTLFTQLIVLSSLSTHTPTAPPISTTKVLQTTISGSNCSG